MYKRAIKIIKIKKNRIQEVNDIILIETPINIYVNSHPIVNIICLPKDIKELAIGFLFSVGIINSIKDIKNIIINKLENNVFIELNQNSIQNLNLNLINRVIDTTCGIPSEWRESIKKVLDLSNQTFDMQKQIKIKKEIIFSSIIKMQKHTELFRETGGCHGAAIFDFNGKMLSIKEDIGRHNAIDKVIGDLLIKGYKFENLLLTSTGRLTGDSVLKALRAKIPIFASLSAAIESGVRLAFAYGLTLIGFVRGSRMNIYTHPNRVDFS
ncbi:MAG: formate dehydrogenase accessory sulfurtransferase FdhD [Promethearchaeota archaeon]